ncbi:1104_t:CDS:2 [Entrophospora sp. SA101]|nr:1104_t:CDS:2 [Entrophospora sp. SA101]
MWKEIGYYDICRDVNDLVIQGCILRLFPLNTPVGWNDPSKKIVVNQLRDLIRVGFKLTKAAMVNILCFCENRLDTIGDSIMLESFCEVRNEPKIDIIQKCLIEMTQADREVKSKVLDFLRRDKNGRGLDSVFLKTIVCHLFDFDTETKGKFDDLEKKEEISLSSSSNSNNIKIQNTKDNNFNHQTTGDNTYIRKKPLDNNSIRQNSVDNKSVHQNSVENNPICQNSVDNNFITKDDKDTSSSIEEEVNDDYFINCQNLLYDNINHYNDDENKLRL